MTYQDERQRLLWQRIVARIDVLSQGSIVGYLGAMWRSTAAFGLYSGVRTLYRRVRLLRWIVRGVHMALLLLEAGTSLLLLLPVLIFGLAGALLMLVGGGIALWHGRRRMVAYMKGRTVMFWNAELALLENERPERTLFGRQLKAYSAYDDVFVIVRSPYIFSCRGFGGSGFYLAFRREDKHVYLARTVAYLALRRTAIRVAKRVIWVV